jgi:hypothetical protein
MGRALDFLGQRNGEVLERNPAFSVPIGQKLVGSAAELSRSPAVNKAEGGSKVRLTSFSEKSRSRTAAPFSASAWYCGGKVGGVSASFSVAV